MLISRTFSANEQYFSLTVNQPIVLLAMSYQLSEQGMLGSQVRKRGPNRSSTVAVALKEHVGKSSEKAWA